MGDQSAVAKRPLTLPTRSSISLHAETDIAEACATVEAEGADHVLVPDQS